MKMRKGKRQTYKDCQPKDCRQQSVRQEERQFCKDDRHLWDIHTHFLPGIDDGPDNWKDSMEMLKQDWENGVRSIVATPHFLPWKENPLPEYIAALCCEAAQRFQKAYGKRIMILPGGELYYHSNLADNLQSGKAMTLNGSKWVLLEFPTDVSFSTLYGGILELENAGYGTILAHMERYSCLQKKDNIPKVKASGALLQVNISGVYGSVFNRRTRWLHKLFKAEVIDVVASDMHNLSSRPPISHRDFAWYEDNLREEYRGNLFSRIPNNLFSGISENLSASEQKMEPTQRK